MQPEVDQTTDSRHQGGFLFLFLHKIYPAGLRYEPTLSSLAGMYCQVCVCFWKTFKKQLALMSLFFFSFTFRITLMHECRTNAAKQTKVSKTQNHDNNVGVVKIWFFTDDASFCQLETEPLSLSNKTYRITVCKMPAKLHHFFHRCEETSQNPCRMPDHQGECWKTQIPALPPDGPLILSKMQV